MLTQPTGLICTPNSNTGTVSGANIATVTVTCTTNSFTIGGNVSGLTGTGLVLHDIGGQNLSITSNGTFVFATPVTSGAVYQVTVQTNPAGQTCSVSSSTGLVASANVSNVTVTCSALSYTIGGSITGLSANGLVLRNNGGDDLPVSSGASTFTFSAAIANGASMPSPSWPNRPD